MLAYRQNRPPIKFGHRVVILRCLIVYGHRKNLDKGTSCNDSTPNIYPIITNSHRAVFKQWISNRKYAHNCICINVRPNWEGPEGAQSHLRVFPFDFTHTTYPLLWDTTLLQTDRRPWPWFTVTNSAGGIYKGLNSSRMYTILAPYRPTWLLWSSRVS